MYPRQVIRDGVNIRLSKEPDYSKFNDEIFISRKIDASAPRYYTIKSGEYKGKKLCVNRYKFRRFQ